MPNYHNPVQLIRKATKWLLISEKK